MLKLPFVAKKCLVCGKKFIPTGRNQKYCSEECKSELYTPAYWVHKTLASRKGLPALGVHEFAKQLKKKRMKDGLPSN